MVAEMYNENYHGCGPQLLEILEFDWNFATSPGNFVVLWLLLLLI